MNIVNNLFGNMHRFFERKNKIPANEKYDLIHSVSMASYSNDVFIQSWRH